MFSFLPTVVQYFIVTKKKITYNTAFRKQFVCDECVRFNELENVLLVTVKMLDEVAVCVFNGLVV